MSDSARSGSGGRAATAPSPRFAQTILELLEQLRAAGYPVADSRLIRDAHDLAATLFSGQYRPSGKPFMDHAVGTASVLVWLEAPVELVVGGGVLHATYACGDFGSGRFGRPVPMADRRAEVRRVVGESAEDFVARYAELPWGPAAIDGFLEQLPTLSEFERHLILARTANMLEDHLDLGILYGPNPEGRLEGVRRRGPRAIELARALGYPMLAQELERAFHECGSVEVPTALQRADASRGVKVCLPPSYRRRFGFNRRGTV